MPASISAINNPGQWSLQKSLAVFHLEWYRIYNNRPFILVTVVSDLLYCSIAILLLHCMQYLIYKLFAQEASLGPNEVLAYNVDLYTMLVDMQAKSFSMFASSNRMLPIYYVPFGNYTLYAKMD